MNGRLCGTCRHWGDGGREEGGLRPCGAVREGDFDYRRDPAPGGELAVLASHEDATLWTRPAFGCVLHESKGA